MLPAHPHQLLAPFQCYQPQLSLRAFPPLYCGGETGKWMWLKHIDCEMSSRGIEGSSECLPMPHLEWGGGDNRFHLAVPAFFMIRDGAGMSSVWWHRCRSVVTSLSCSFSGLHIRWQHGGWIGNEKHTLLSESQANEGRNVLDHDMIPLLPLALLELSAKLLPIRVS